MRLKILVTLYSCIWLTLFVSCKSDNSQISSQRYLKNIIGKKIEIPKDLIALRLYDSVKFNDFISSKFKIVYYVDSSECNECNVRYMTLFKEFFTKVNNKSIPLLIIFNTNDFFDINIFMNKYDIKFPYFLDLNNSFINNNKYLKSGLLDVLLLRNDTIIFAGNSKYNERFYNLFLDQVGK